MASYRARYGVEIGCIEKSGAMWATTSWKEKHYPYGVAVNMRRCGGGLNYGEKEAVTRAVGNIDDSILQIARRRAVGEIGNSLYD